MSAVRRRTGSKNGSTTAEDVDGVTKMVNRRGLLRKAGLAAGGGAVVALAGVGAKPARAANGNPVTLGASNTATSDTRITTTSGVGLYGQTSDPNAAGLEGIDASNSSGGFAVYARSYYGTGIAGSSASGIGVAALSETTSPLYVSPGNHSGPLTTGTHNAGEIYVDIDLAMWLCTAGGTPGTWRPIVVGGLTNNVGAAQTVLSASVPGVAALNVVNATSSNPTTSGLYAQVGGPSGQPATAAVIGNTNQGGRRGSWGPAQLAPASWA